MLKTILVSASRKKAVHSSPVRQSAPKSQDSLTKLIPSLRSPSVSLLVKKVRHTPALCKLLGVGDLCFHFVILCTFHRAECNTSAQHLTTTCPQLWSLKIHPICRVSLLKRGEQLGFPTCALPWTAEGDQPAGRSHRHQAFHVSLWQVAQLLVRGMSSCSNRNGDNSLCSAQASYHRAKSFSTNSFNALLHFTSSVLDMAGI